MKLDKQPARFDDDFREAVVSTISPEAAAFLEEIESVCRKHGMTLAASGYDSLQVWKLQEGDALLHFDGIVDRTQGEDAQ